MLMRPTEPLMHLRVLRLLNFRFTACAHDRRSASCSPAGSDVITATAIANNYTHVYTNINNTGHTFAAPPECSDFRFAVASLSSVGEFGQGSCSWALVGAQLLAWLPVVRAVGLARRPSMRLRAHIDASGNGDVRISASGRLQRARDGAA